MKFNTLYSILIISFITIILSSCGVKSHYGYKSTNRINEVKSERGFDFSKSKKIKGDNFRDKRSNRSNLKKRRPKSKKHTTSDKIVEPIKRYALETDETPLNLWKDKKIKTSDNSHVNIEVKPTVFSSDDTASKQVEKENLIQSNTLEASKENVKSKGEPDDKPKKRQIKERYFNPFQIVIRLLGLYFLFGLIGAASGLIVFLLAFALGPAVALVIAPILFSIYMVFYVYYVLRVFRWADGSEIWSLKKTFLIVGNGLIVLSLALYFAVMYTL